MSSELETKVDRLIRLLEEQEMKISANSDKRLIQELVINTVLASTVGYFMFRILDHHFRRSS